MKPLTTSFGQGHLELLLVVVLNAAGNVLLKVGTAPRWPVIAGFSLVSLTGLGFFVLSVLLYARALHTVPLSEAQIIVAAQYAVTIVAAVVLLGEHVSLSRWLGVALMAAGIYLCFRQ